MKCKLQIFGDQIKIITDIVALSERDLFVKAMANSSYIFNMIESYLYNPQNMLFSTKAIQYVDKNNPDIYVDAPNIIYSKFENISKIVVANLIIETMDIVLKDIYNLYIPSSFTATEFNSLKLNDEKGIGIGHLLFTANSIIYTSAVLKLFEETIKNRNQKKVYKDMIKNYLQAFVDNDSQHWLTVANSYVLEEYSLPIQKLYFLLKFHTR